jgi:hypothetical protein
MFSDWDFFMSNKMGFMNKTNTYFNLAYMSLNSYFALGGGAISMWRSKRGFVDSEKRPEEALSGSNKTRLMPT